MATEVGILRTRLSFETTGQTSLTDLQRDLRGIRSEMNNFRAGGRQYRTSLQGMRQESDILTRRLEVQQKRVEELKRRYEESAKQTGETSAQTRNLQVQYNNAQAEMKRTEQQLERLNQTIRLQESRVYQLGQSWVKSGENLQKIGRQLTDFGKTYSMRVTAPIIAGGTAVFKAAMDYESAFAGVRKTVDATEEQYERLSDAIIKMSREIPASAVEIANVAEVAGQLGIAQENIIQFTRTMIDLGESTTMSSEQAATSLARLANITQMPMDQIDRLGSTVVDLGNNLATTEGEIVEMGLRLAGAGNQIGLTEAQILSFAGALSSVGVRAEAGGTAFSRVFLNINTAVMDAGEELQAFAKVANMSAKEFKELFERDASLALLAFIEGLAKLSDEGANTAKVLADLGLGEIRVRDALMRAAGASNVFRNSLEIGNRAWEENVALQEEAEQRYRTTESQLKMMWNRAKEVAITLGEALAPAVIDVINASEPLINKIREGAQSFADMNEEQQRTILKLIGFVAAVGPASMVVGSLTNSIGGLLRVGGSLFTLLGRATSGAGLLGRIGMLGVAGPVGLAIAGVAGLTYYVHGLVTGKNKLNTVTTRVADRFWEQADSLEDLVNEYDKLNRKSRLSSEEFGRLVDIQKELETAQNPARVAELTEKYNELLDKSGLTNEEFERLYELNNKIIEQSSNVETSFTNKGTAIVESTDAVKEYIQSLRDMAFEELKLEQWKAEENREKLLAELTEAREEIEKINKDINMVLKASELSNEQITAQISAREKILREMIRTEGMQVALSEDYKQLQEEIHFFMMVQNGEAVEMVNNLEKKKDEHNKIIEKNEEEIAKLELINARMAEMLLAEVDINWEKGEGLKILDERIDKLKEERDNLLANASEEEKNSTIFKERLYDLEQAIAKHKSIREQIKAEVGYQSQQNNELEKQKRKYDELYEKGKRALDEFRQKEEKHISLKITNLSEIEKRLAQPITKRLNIDIGAGRNFAIAPLYAEGTSFHPGGPFIAGEEGVELGKYGNRFELLPFGMYDRPQGYKVFTHEETKKILNSLNNIPAYANGARTAHDVSNLVNQNNMSNVEALLQQLIYAVREGKNIILNGRVVGREITPYVTEEQERTNRFKGAFA